MASNSVRVSIAWLPDEPQFSAVIKASKAITNLYDNSNVIDEKRFPPHASVHICTLPLGSIDQVADEVRKAVSTMTVLLPPLVPERVIAGSGGYISLALQRRADVMSVHEAVLAAVAKVRGEDFDEEPYWLRNASEDDRRNFARYGNVYVQDKFDLHYSVAKVDQRDQQAAKKIAEEKLGGLATVSATALQICDIGPRSEKWEILTSI